MAAGLFGLGSAANYFVANVLTAATFSDYGLGIKMSTQTPLAAQRTKRL